jgi:hypothetical protein
MRGSVRRRSGGRRSLRRAERLHAASPALPDRWLRGASTGAGLSLRAGARLRDRLPPSLPSIACCPQVRADLVLPAIAPRSRARDGACDARWHGQHRHRRGHSRTEASAGNTRTRVERGSWARERAPWRVARDPRCPMAPRGPRSGSAGLAACKRWGARGRAQTRATCRAEPRPARFLRTRAQSRAVCPHQSQCPRRSRANT